MGPAGGRARKINKNVMQELVKQLREVLEGIRYPGTTQSIVSALHMVQGIRLEGDTVYLNLVFKQSGDPFSLSLKEKCKQALLDSGYVEHVEIELLYLDKLERPLSLAGVQHVVAVSSGKGGVGKSTVSANLAVALAAEGYRVGLIDADIFGPSIPKLFGLEEVRPTFTEAEGKTWIEPVERFGVKILSIGFFVDPAAATVWRGPMASGALKQLIEEGHWGALDYLLIDLPPGTSDIHLTLVQTVALSGALVVSTPQPVALADAVKGINMFESEGINVPVLGIVENMSWFTPAELPDHKYYIFGQGGAARLAASKNLPLLGEIPLVQGIRESGDNGRPVALEPVTGKAFTLLAHRLTERMEEVEQTARRVRVNG